MRLIIDNSLFSVYTDEEYNVKLYKKINKNSLKEFMIQNSFNFTFKPNHILSNKQLKSLKNELKNNTFINGFNMKCYNKTLDNFSFIENNISFIIGKLIYQLCEIHDNNLCHGEIIKNNIHLKVEKDKIKKISLGNFHHSNATNHYRKYYSPYYFKNGKCYSLKEDIFSFGLMLYELLTGNDKFKNCKNLLEVLNSCPRNDKVLKYYHKELKNDFLDSSIGIFQMEVEYCGLNNKDFNHFFKNSVKYKILNIDLISDLIYLCLNPIPDDRVSSTDIFYFWNSKKYFNKYKNLLTINSNLIEIYIINKYHIEKSKDLQNLISYILDKKIHNYMRLLLFSQNKQIKNFIENENIFLFSKFLE